MNDDVSILLSKKFRKIIIADSRNLFHINRSVYEPLTDLVLTYDFGLKKEVESAGGIALYLDHLCSQEIMQENNFLLHKYYQEWNLDRYGNDIFSYKKINYGFSFRIEICQDLVYYTRLRICLSQLNRFHFEKLEVFTRDKFILDILSIMNLTYSQGLTIKDHVLPNYFFPIRDWIEMRLRKSNLRQTLRDSVMFAQGLIMSLIDVVLDFFMPIKTVFIQEYIPTRDILKKIQKVPGLRVIQGHYSAPFSFNKIFYERLVPVHPTVQKYVHLAPEIIERYVNRRFSRLVLANGIDITDEISAVIQNQVARSLPRVLRDLDGAMKYFNMHSLQLVVLIGNMGQLAMLVDCVAKNMRIPSYLIINGLLGYAYMDEGKYATFINSYSTSIRDNYFRGMENIYCLGDPRMDEYVLSKKRIINRKFPTITIGAAGYGIDLNCYVAFEFDFLYDTLLAIENVVKSRDLNINLILKVRSNGYIGQYKAFIDEYFPLLKNVQLIDSVTMKSVLEKTDFYISFFSQTLFEASVLGIPAVYYRKDDEIMDPPFDGKSELVTADSVKELEQSIVDFLDGNERYDDFLKTEVMERYVGPLDGKNLDRNLDFIKRLIFK